MSARWKAIELEVCRVFGGKRSGPTGKDGPDCIHTEPFAVQVKHRDNVPKWLTDAMAQAERDAGGDLATLVLHRKGDAVRDSLVIFRLRGFADWYL